MSLPHGPLRDLGWGVPVLLCLMLGEISKNWVDFNPAWLHQIWIAAIPLWTGFLVWRLSRTLTDNTRRFWLAIALYCGCYGVTAMLSQTLGADNAQRLLSPSNVTFLLGTGVLFLASITLWPRLVGWQGLRQLLEVLIVTVGKLLFLWCWSFGGLFERYISTASTPLTVLFVFMVCGLLIESLVVLAPAESRPFPRWLAGGLVLLNVVTNGYLAQLVQGNLGTPWWFSAVGALGLVLILVAAASMHLPEPTYHTRIVQGLWYLPRVFFVVGLLVFLLITIQSSLSALTLRIATYLFTAVAALVSLHQFLIQLENSRLNRDLLELTNTLEHRVAERSKELEQSRNHLLAAERLASLGQLTAGLAHEVNTPLAAAMTSFKQAGGLAHEYQQSIGHPEVTPADHREIASELRQKLGTGLANLERLGEIVRKMRSQTRLQNEGKVQVNLASVLRDALDLLQHPAMKAKVKLTLHAPHELTWACEPGRLSQVLTNLVTNAIQACEDARALGSGAGGQVQVRLLETHDDLRIEVEDDGPGIPETVRERIFEPLFTTKEAGRGTGLGLPIVRDIVTSNLGGRLEFETTVGHGTTFRVTIPKQAEAVAR